MRPSYSLKYKLASLFVLMFCCAHVQAATFYLIRHAEKQTGDDPSLTQAGHERAHRIANLLAQAHIKKIYSTDYRRTQQTASPLAQKLAVPITTYNPKNLQQLAKKLRQSKENVVIFGHSNTTPQLVRLLSGQAIPDMDESTYHLIYQVITFPESKNNKTAVNVLSSQ
ncbi:hypothetical protein GCM10011365_09950 [Marinicella pacifica]|uniref:Histidine phosphatase family protein n=1 Tax=Marinicella pacifica TaxID=1171543 RepID=A0A917FM11_9GAMM|nr:phosphoglycerate mutase family protein [Marinicella pacifica]GGF90823.1 hypothetical protein GCM10011365_09950 [Marinicella pacifica]